jgi:methylase of polypeptide subunit release factors
MIFLIEKKENLCFLIYSFTAKRILNLGTGDGRLLRLLKMGRPEIETVVIDVSPTMVKSVKKNFVNDKSVRIAEHDLQDPLPELGYFDAIISSFAYIIGLISASTLYRSLFCT